MESRTDAIGNVTLPADEHEASDTDASDSTDSHGSEPVSDLERGLIHSMEQAVEIAKANGRDDSASLEPEANDDLDDDESLPDPRHERVNQIADKIELGHHHTWTAEIWADLVAELRRLFPRHSGA